MTDAWGDLATYRQKKRQKFKVYLTKGVSVNPKAYCCDDNTINDQKPPVAILTATPNPIYEGEDLTLDMTGSYDPDGGGIPDPGGYHIWDGIGGEYAATKTEAGITYPNAGRFEAKGVVTDTDGLMGQASTWVEVLGGENPPEPPDGPDPEGVGKRIIAATNPYGIAVCLDRLASPPVWTALNDGLSGADLQIVDLIIDPWNTDRAVICTATGDVFENTDIWDGGSWSSIYDASVEGPCDHDNKAVRVRKGNKDENFVLLVVEGQDVGHSPIVYIVHSHTDGAAWPTSVQLLNAAVPGWGHRCQVAMSDQEVGGSLIASPHDADVIFVSGMSGKGVANWMSPTVWKSIDKAHTFPILQYERDNNAGATDKCVPIKVPHDNNPTDQKILIGCWYVLEAPAKKGPYYVEDGLADDPVAADEFSGLPGGHVLVDDTVPPRGSHGIATWAQAHVKLFTQTAGPNYHVILSDDWGRTFLVRAIVDPGAVAFKMRSGSTWPYDPNLFVIGRASSTSAYMILITESAGVTFTDLTGNLRTVLGADGAAPYPAMRITQIVFDWLS